MRKPNAEMTELKQKTRDILQADILERLNPHTKQYEPVVAIFQNLRSEKIIKYIPLRLFTEDFRKMWGAELFAKVYMDAGEVAAISIYKTIFHPKIGNHQNSRK